MMLSVGETVLENGSAPGSVEMIHFSAQERTSKHSAEQVVDASHPTSHTVEPPVDVLDPQIQEEIC